MLIANLILQKLADGDVTFQRSLRLNLYDVMDVAIITSLYTRMFISVYNAVVYIDIFIYYNMVADRTILIRYVLKCQSSNLSPYSLM